MFVELLLFVALGIALGIIFGLIPGIHPNMVVLALPLFLSLNMDPSLVVAFFVALGVSNAMADFLPSMLLSASDSNEMAIMPAHRLLLAGHGYTAVKLAVIGGLFSVVLCVLLLPLLVFTIPTFYAALGPFIWILLLAFSMMMIFSEPRKFLAAVAFLSAGAIGLMLNSLPVNNIVILFPVLSGLFGASIIVIQLREKVVVPRQNREELAVSKRTFGRSVLSGAVAGIFSGFLPGIGSSELSSFASIDKNEKSFLITIGAITVSNVLLSVLSLWLIGHARSGIAVVIGSLTDLTMNEILIIASVALMAAAISAVIVLSSTKKFLSMIQKINYTSVSTAVLAAIVLMTIVFSGLVGLLVLVTCAALGVAVNLLHIKRGLLMAVLIVPTTLFYAGL